MPPKKAHKKHKPTGHNKPITKFPHTKQVAPASSQLNSADNSNLPGLDDNQGDGDDDDIIALDTSMAGLVLNDVPACSDDQNDSYHQSARAPLQNARPNCKCIANGHDMCINEHIPLASCHSFPPYDLVPTIYDRDPDRTWSILGEIVTGGPQCHRFESWLTSSRGDHGIKVAFYPEGQFPAPIRTKYERQTDRLKVARTVLLCEPKTKTFLDETHGIRFETPAVWVFEIGITRYNTPAWQFTILMRWHKRSRNK